MVTTKYRFNNKIIKEIQTEDFPSNYLKEKIEIDGVIYMSNGVWREIKEKRQIIELFEVEE